MNLEHTYKGLEKDGLKAEDWLLIEIATLKAIKKDADAYKLSLEKLQEAQEKHIKDVEEKNLLRMEKHQLQKDNYKLQVRVYELENPPWFQSPWFWGAAGGAVGIIAGSLIVGYASGGL